MSTSAAPYGAVQVHGAPEHEGLRVDHPRLKEYILNGFKMGWGNEHICRVTGSPPSVVSQLRSQYEKEKRQKV